MHRAVLEALLPWLLILAAAFVVLWLTARLSGARWQLRRLAALHTCQAGSVQSLSFVLTLPIFIIILLFIVQVSQLMIGVTVVHYAAFAAARAAMVWIPATTEVEPANQVVPELHPVHPSGGPPEWIVPELKAPSRQTTTNWRDRAVIDSHKYYKIWEAATLACVPISPSRRYYQSGTGVALSQTLRAFYAVLAPSSATNPRIPVRIENKLAYSMQNTIVRIDGLDRHARGGFDPDGRTLLTYNPDPGYWAPSVNPYTGEPIPVFVPWKDYEIGWADPMTVTVMYDLALLPGIGRVLATRLTGNTPDTVSPRVQLRTDAPSGKLYTTRITASLTLSNEGLKSVMPYVQTMD